jgi:hypothetical protein
MRGSIFSPRGDRSRFVASTTIEVSDVQRFVADPAEGVGVVGGIDSPAWGYRPFVDGSATVTALSTSDIVRGPREPSLGRVRCFPWCCRNSGQTLARR